MPTKRSKSVKKVAAKPSSFQQPTPTVHTPTLTPRVALTMQEAGAAAGVSAIVIRREIARGRLKACRIGYRRIRVPVDALTAYLKQRAAEGV